jgi:hypothetical protein
VPFSDFRNNQLVRIGGREGGRECAEARIDLTLNTLVVDGLGSDSSCWLNWDECLESRDGISSIERFRKMRHHEALRGSVMGYEEYRGIDVLSRQGEPPS